MEQTTGGRSTAESVFIGDSELAERCRDRDWASTPLGPVESWPAELRTIVRAALGSPFPICIWAGPELLLIYNDGYRRVLGEKHPAAIARPGLEVWSEIKSTLLPMFESLRQGGPAVYAEDERFVMKREKADVGSDGWFTFALSAIRDEAGEMIGFLNIVSETTDRIRAEAEAARLLRALELERSRLGYVFQQAPTFLAVLRGRDHVFELANDAYFQLVGHREVLGLPAATALPEVREQGFIDILDRVLETGEPFIGRSVSIQLQRVPGAPTEERFVDFAYLPIIEADGSRSGIIAHGTDVTEQVVSRREVERLLVESERARAEADAANRTKSEFLATMSHEFRTPLNAILGYAQLLDMGVLGPATPAQQAHLERLQTSARHLLRLVDDVLDVAKVDADRLEVRRDVLTTGSALASALALVQPQATAKGVRMFDFGSDMPGVRYIGDEHRVRQILVNLLSNAVKFTPPGGEVRMVSGLAAEPGMGAQVDPAELASHDVGEDADLAWAFVNVEDTGPGIPPELLGRLFEPFVQGDSALTREAGGTGLGLAISRRLARLMGGDITARSKAGGAIFTLWLPGVRQETTALPPAERSGFRTPIGMAAIGPPGSGAAATEGLDDAAFAIVHALGVRLAADAETVAERYVAALRADDRFPGVRELPTVQLRDHATPVVGLLATQLMVIGETRGQAPELLGDGGQVQRLIDELHGAQRLRLGWGEADIEREMPLLLAEIERALLAAVDTATTTGVPPAVTEASRGDAITSPAVRAATRYAADVVRHIVDRSTRTAIRAHRFAKSAEAR